MSTNSAPYFLYADDDPDDQEMLTDMMGRVDPSVRVICCDQGLELLQFMANLENDESYPCCIILDMNMPLWDGMRTLQELKKYPETSAVPVVMFTTSSGERERRRAIELGAMDFLTKPTYPAEFAGVARRMAALCLLPSLQKKTGLLSH